MKGSDWIEKEDYRKKVLARETQLGDDKIIQIVEVDPGDHVKPHKHYSTREIYVIQQPGGRIRIEDKEYETEKDQVIVCEPGQVHEVINDSENTLRILVFKTGHTVNDTHWL